MKLNIEINTTLPRPPRAALICNAVKKTLNLAGCPELESKNILVSLAFIGTREIQRLNKIYRGRNKATNVLSFSEYKNRKELQKEKKKNIYLGEITACLEEIKKSAIIKHIPIQKEAKYVVSHGVLHLLGFSHGKKMFGIQDKIAEL